MSTSTTAKTDQPRPVLAIEFESGTTYSSDNYSVMTGKMIFLDAAGEQTSAYGHELSDFQFRAQADCRSRSSGFYGEAFGIKHSYGLIGLTRAQTMVRVLSKLERGMDKIVEQDGWHRSLGQYISRCCRVMGIAAIGFYRPGGGVWANGERLQLHFGGGNIQARVDSVVFDWMAEQGQFARKDSVA